MGIKLQKRLWQRLVPAIEPWNGTIEPSHHVRHSAPIITELWLPIRKLPCTEKNKKYSYSATCKWSKLFETANWYAESRYHNHVACRGKIYIHPEQSRGIEYDYIRMKEHQDLQPSLVCGHTVAYCMELTSSTWDLKRIAEFESWQCRIHQIKKIIKMKFYSS